MHVWQEITGAYFQHHHQCPANILTHFSILISSYSKQSLGMQTNPVRNVVWCIIHCSFTHLNKGYNVHDECQRLVDDELIDTRNGMRPAQ